MRTNRARMRTLALACMTALALSSASGPSGAQTAQNRQVYKDEPAAPLQFEDAWRDELRARAPRGPQSTTTITTTTTTTTTSGPTDIWAGCLDNEDVLYRFPSTSAAPQPSDKLWYVSNDHNTDSRDLRIKRWTGSGYSDLVPLAPNDTANSDWVIYGEPIHAMGSGEVIVCWRNAPENPDTKTTHPGRAGCDGDPGGAPCTIPRSGNFVGIKTASGEILLHAHFQPGSIPPELCPHNAEFVADAEAEAVHEGAYYDDIYIPPGQRPKVEKGEFIGLAGNSGASSNPHLHIHRKPGVLCGSEPLRLHGVLEQDPGDGPPSSFWQFHGGPLSEEGTSIVYIPID